MLLTRKPDRSAPARAGAFGVPGWTLGRRQGDRNMRNSILLLLCCASAACDPYINDAGEECVLLWCDEPTGGDKDESEWDADLPAIDPGTDPCAVIAEVSGLALVWSDTLVYNAPTSTATVPAIVEVEGVANWASDGPLGGAWWLADTGAQQRIQSVRTRVQTPESNPVTDGSSVTVWVVADGDVWLRQTENGALPDAEIALAPYGSVNDTWKIAAGTIPTLVDDFNFGGEWTLDTLHASGILGIVGASRTAAIAEPEIAYGFDPVRDKSNDYRTWLPYGGFCYLALPSGLDESGS